jgi:hypothetical protein
MVKKETITISLDSETLDAIRKQALASYRSISKHIAYLLDNAITDSIEALIVSLKNNINILRNAKDFKDNSLNDSYNENLESLVSGYESLKILNNIIKAESTGK